MFIIHYCCYFDRMIGPVDTLDSARAILAKIVEDQEDPLFKDRTSLCGPDELGYAGYDQDELEAAGADPDLAKEIWLQVHQLVPADESLAYLSFPGPSERD